jgi:hypothetical protein
MTTNPTTNPTNPQARALIMEAYRLVQKVLDRGPCADDYPDLLLFLDSVQGVMIDEGWRPTTK